VCGSTATSLVLNSKPGGAGAAITATFTLGVNGVLQLSVDDGFGFAVCAAGQGLSATTGTGSTVAVQVQYVIY
jgi:hypothetical protein